MILKKIALFVIFAIASISAFAQGGEVIGVAQYANINGYMLRLSGATITACTYTGSLSCVSPLTIYSDEALTQPLGTSTVSDGNGNYNFFISPGSYVVSVAAVGYTTFLQKVTVPVTASALISSTLAIDVTSFNGRCEVRTTVQAAINSCPGTAVHVGPGIFPANSSTAGATVTNSNQSIICDGPGVSNIVYTGSTPITAVLDIGTSDTGAADLQNITIENCTISGNANVANAVRTRGVHRSKFIGLDVRNSTGPAFLMDDGVTNILSAIHTSKNEGVFTTTPSNCIKLTGPNASFPSSNNTIIAPVCELYDATKDGIYLDYAMYTHITGGTSENNGRGLYATSHSTGVTLETVDFEANTTEDIYFNGTGLTILGGLFGSTTTLHVGSLAGGEWVANQAGLDTGNVTIDAGGGGVLYMGTNSSPSLNNTFGTAVFDSGVQQLSSKTLVAPIVSGNLIMAGTAPTITGTGACATTSTQKGANSGQIVCTGTTGASTLTITPATAATNGFDCHGSDVTNTLAGSVSAASTTACTLTFSSVTANDVVTFGAIAY